MRNSHQVVRAVALAVSTLAAWPTLAQQQASEEAVGLEEVVVTAQRREENLQAVPLAVTALNADTLARNDIRDMSRVERVTPGFSRGKSGSDARPAIRGVRTENVAVSGDPTIGFFVDNLYRGRASQANEPFVDALSSVSRCSAARRAPCTGATRSVEMWPCPPPPQRPSSPPAWT